MPPGAAECRHSRQRANKPVILALVFLAIFSLDRAALPSLSAASHRPWTAEETNACFIVRDANGQALADVYFEEEPGRRSAAHLLTRDEAWRVGVNIANCRSRCGRLDLLRPRPLRR